MPASKQRRPIAEEANATIFGLADALFLRPLDVPDPAGPCVYK